MHDRSTVTLIHKPASCRSWWGRWRMPGRLTGDTGNPSWMHRPQFSQTAGWLSPHLQRPMDYWCQLGRRAGNSSQMQRSPDHGNSSTSTADARAIEVLCFLETRNLRCFVASLSMDLMQQPDPQGTGYCTAFFLVLLIWGSWTCMLLAQLQNYPLKHGGWFACLQSDDLIGSSTA